MKPCWRCEGRGHLGRLKSGYKLRCRLCHGTGQLPDNRPIRLTVGNRWHRVKQWLAGWWDRHIAHEYRGPGEI